LRPVRRADPRSAAAAALSFVFPGLGQGYNRRWLLAVLLAIPVVLLIGLGTVAVASGGSGLISRLLDARVLVALVILNLALLGWRLVAILQAHADRQRLTARAWPTWVTAGLVVITLGMHALPAYYAVKAIDTLGSVSLEGGGALFDERVGRDIDIPEPSDQPDLELHERVTVLLLGIDFAPGRDHHLTDTMLVASIDPRTGEGALVSVPRDLYGTPLGDGRVYNAKLNSLMSVAADDPATYPLGGPGTLKAAVGALLGTRIHYFAAIDIEGMRQVIDIIGGVDVVVERTIDDPRYFDSLTGQRGFYLDAGPRHLDGATAMAYARSRQGAGDDDFTRAERQQHLLTAIADKLTAGNLLVTLPGLLDAVRDNMATDIPSGRLPLLAAEAEGADLGSLDRVVLQPPEHVTPMSDPVAGYVLVPNLDAILALGADVFGDGRSERPDAPHSQ
jgi:LCP family protein required for cell wall assembly